MCMMAHDESSGEIKQNSADAVECGRFYVAIAALAVLAVAGHIYYHSFYKPRHRK